MSGFETSNQTLVGHLGELRRRIVFALYFIVAGFFVCFYYSEVLFNVIRAPIAPYLPPNQGLVFTAPLDKFMAHIQVAALGGLILTAPFWLYQCWAFVAPGLYRREKKFAVYFILAGTFLFLTGVGFTYWVVFPGAFKYLLSFGGSIDTPMITINEYLSFFLTTALAFGVAFELPLVLVMLGIFGIIDVKFLREKRRYAVVFMSILAGILTPPDAISMLMMLVPLCLLYEGAIVVLLLLKSKKSDSSLSSEELRS